MKEQVEDWPNHAGLVRNEAEKGRQAFIGNPDHCFKSATGEPKIYNEVTVTANTLDGCRDFLATEILAHENENGQPIVWRRKPEIMSRRKAGKIQYRGIARFIFVAPDEIPRNMEERK